MEANRYPRWFAKIPAKYKPTEQPEVNPYIGWFFKLILVLSIMSFVFSLWEWFTIGILKDQEKIGDYMFGSAGMLGEGGENYASAEIYATLNLRSAIVSLPIILLFLLAVKRPTLIYRLLAVASILIVGTLCRVFDF